MKKTYYCFAADRNENGIINKYHILCVGVPENGENPDFSVLPPMTAQEISDSGTEPLNMALNNEEGSVNAVLEPSASTYPSVYCDDTGIHLAVKPFTAHYHRLNPGRIWPSKPELMRTVTVIAETERVTKKYVNYLVTNRKLPILNNHYAEHGYYVCDYNGSVAYLSLVQMQSVGNRYGFTNAKLSGNRVLQTDGREFMRLPPPSDELIKQLDSVSYLGGEITDKFDMKQLRLYADTFFVFRRQQFGSAERKATDTAAVDEFRESIEAFHQALLHRTVSVSAYSGIENRLGELLCDDESSEAYKKIERELIEQIPCRYFRNTDAFMDMLNAKGSVLPEGADKKKKAAQLKIAALQTFSELAPEIVEQYCGIILTEKEISAVLIALKEKLDFGFQGFEFRLKSPDSLYEKLYERSNEAGKTTEELFEETRDILRYTVCFRDPDDYCSGIQQIVDYITKKYHAQLNGFRNYWTPYVPGDYRGLNVSIRLPELYWNFREERICLDSSWKNSRYCITVPSFCLEIQFHTDNSYAVKTENHKLYEETRRSDFDESLRGSYTEQMKKNLERVKIPKGADFMYMDSNEYITALYDFVDFLRGELAQIKENCRDNPLIDQSLFRD